MDALNFLKQCPGKSPIDLADVALGVFTQELPEELEDTYDLVMSIDLLADTLFEEKEFAKVEQLVCTLQQYQKGLYQDSIFSLLPNLVYFHLFNHNLRKVEYYMRELANVPEQDLLLFVHLLDVLDAYGQDEMMNQIVTDVLTTNTQLDEEDQEFLESYLVAVDPITEDFQLKAIRRGFLNRAPYWGIPSITAENIIDALIDYFEKTPLEDRPHQLYLQENSFRQYIASLLDLDFLDTYEYAGSILWGSIYLMEQLQANGVISEEDSLHNRMVIEKNKAFFWINIPWNGYWRMKFLYNWGKPWSVSDLEFFAEKDLVEQNLFLKPEDILNRSVKIIFGKYEKDLSYGEYLEQEQILFEKFLKENNRAFFGEGKKKDSMFPFLNYLSGEEQNTVKPMPKGFCQTQQGAGGNENCSPEINPI